MLTSIAMKAACWLTLIVSTTCAGKVTKPQNAPKNAILLSNVESLTFRAGRNTASRRVSPVPQLSCVGPQEVCDLYTVDVMRCTNEGSDYNEQDIQWTCKADLPEEFKLGSTEVSCEGYASSSDPYVLKGSCGVEYRLILTNRGEKRYPDVIKPHITISPSGNSSSVVFFIIFFAVLAVIIHGMCTSAARNPPRLGGPRRPGGFGAPGGYNGGDDDDDPPPPYDDGSSRPFSKASSQRSSYSAGSSRQDSQSWRPGPWTAAAAGAGVGYALGRNSGRTPRQSSRSYNSGPSSSSFSGSTHESTGFGGTSRR